MHALYSTRFSKDVCFSSCETCEFCPLHPPRVASSQPRIYVNTHHKASAEGERSADSTGEFYKKLQPGMLVDLPIQTRQKRL